MDGLRKEVPFESLGSLIYTVLAVLATKSQLGSVRIRAEKNILHPFFAKLHETYGRDYSVLCRLSFTGENGFLYSQELQDTFDKLCEGGILNCSEKVISVIPLSDTEAWMNSQVNRAFAGNVRKRLHFDSMVCRFAEILMPD